MSDHHRYAVYYLPDEPQLAAFGAAWLGWDVKNGNIAQQPDIPDIDLPQATATPRKYGFHGTLKPPFRLAGGTSLRSLESALETFAQRTAPVMLGGLRLARLGRFLALVPDADSKALAELAFACVSEFDVYRAPPGIADLERRRASGLSPRQDALLLQWGYPFVADEFRFHLTLSGKCDTATLDTLEAVAARLMPRLAAPFPIESIALVGERDDGRFEELHRYALTG